MNKSLLIVGLCSILSLTWWSCDNDLDLIAEWKEVPVIYGFITPDSGDQYVRVEKVFLDKNTSALVLAKNPDSLYFKNVTVQIERTATGQKANLEMVNGDDVGLPRQPGVFANHPNYLYRLSSGALPLVQDENYEIKVIKEDGSILARSSAGLVGNYNMGVGTPNQSIGFRYDNAPRISFTTSESSAVVYDVFLHIHIDEYLPDNPNVPVPKTLVWQIEKLFPRPGQNKSISVFAGGQAFFSFLKNNLETSASISRKFRSIDIVVDAGGKEFYDYINVIQANSGITGAEYVPAYTNVDNGLGLFSSRSRLVATGYSLHSSAIDLLINGDITKDLNFF